MQEALLNSSKALGNLQPEEGDMPEAKRRRQSSVDAAKYAAEIDLALGLWPLEASEGARILQERACA